MLWKGLVFSRSAHSIVVTPLFYIVFIYYQEGRGIAIPELDHVPEFKETNTSVSSEATRDSKGQRTF